MSETPAITNPLINEVGGTLYFQWSEGTGVKVDRLRESRS